MVKRWSAWGMLALLLCVGVGLAQRTDVLAWEREILSWSDRVLGLASQVERLISDAQLGEGDMLVSLPAEVVEATTDLYSEGLALSESLDWVLSDLSAAAADSGREVDRVRYERMYAHANQVEAGIDALAVLRHGNSTVEVFGLRMEIFELSSEIADIWRMV